MRTEFQLPKGATIDPEGIWAQVLVPLPDGDAKPALFLDRDGVILEEVNYLCCAKDTHLIPGATKVVSAANRYGVPVIIVTNQAGIGYGYYGWEEFALVQEKLISDIAMAKSFINGVFACPHHAKGKPPYAHPDPPSRKPNPGMLLQAANMLNLDISRSWIIGDKASDVGAGKNAGLAGAIHVLTGHGADKGERESAQSLAENNFKVLTTKSIAESIPLLGSLGIC